MVVIPSLFKFIQNIKNLSGKLPDGIFKKLFIQEIKKISQVNLNEDLKENTPEKSNTDNKITNTSFKIPIIPLLL